MFDFIPGWLSALIACVVMVAIGVQGFALTSKKSDGSTAAPKDNGVKKE